MSTGPGWARGLHRQGPKAPLLVAGEPAQRGSRLCEPDPGPGPSPQGAWADSSVQPGHSAAWGWHLCLPVKATACHLPVGTEACPGEYWLRLPWRVLGHVGRK